MAKCERDLYRLSSTLVNSRHCYTVALVFALYFLQGAKRCNYFD